MVKGASQNGLLRFILDHTLHVQQAGGKCLRIDRSLTVLPDGLLRRKDKNVNWEKQVVSNTNPRGR